MVQGGGRSARETLFTSTRDVSDQMDDGMLRVVCECVFHFNTPKILHIPWYLHFFSSPATTVRVTRSSSTSSTCTSSGDELAMVATSRFGRRHLFAADGRFPCTRSTRTEPSQAHPNRVLHPLPYPNPFADSPESTSSRVEPYGARRIYPPKSKPPAQDATSQRISVKKVNAVSTSTFRFGSPRRRVFPV